MTKFDKANCLDGFNLGSTIYKWSTEYLAQLVWAVLFTPEDLAHLWLGSISEGNIAFCNSLGFRLSLNLLLVHCKVKIFRWNLFNLRWNLILVLRSCKIWFSKKKIVYKILTIEPIIHYLQLASHHSSYKWIHSI